MILRIFASIVLIFSVFFLPLWVSIILAIAGIIYFPLFFEAVAIFFLSDLLYGTKETHLFGMIFISMISTLIFLVIAELLKKKLKFYPK